MSCSRKLPVLPARWRVDGARRPDRGHRRAMDLSELGEREAAVSRPRSRLDGLAVHPVGSVGIPTDLHVLAKLLVTDGTSFGEQHLDLPQHQGVALDRRGVMRLLEPDAAPDVAGLERVRETAHPLPQLLDLEVEPAVHVLTAMTAPTTMNLFAHPKSKCTEQIYVCAGGRPCNRTEPQSHACDSARLLRGRRTERATGAASENCRPPTGATLSIMNRVRTRVRRNPAVYPRTERRDGSAVRTPSAL